MKKLFQYFVVAAVAFFSALVRPLLIGMTIVLVLILIRLSFTACVPASKQEIEREQKAMVSAAPYITDFEPKRTFRVVAEVERVDGLDIGRAILKMDGVSLFVSAMVVPMRRIPIGTIVKVVTISYRGKTIGFSNYTFTVVK